MAPSCSPTLPSFSCEPSPSLFSPMALPTTGFEAPGFIDTSGWPLNQQSTPAYLSTPLDVATNHVQTMPEPFPMFSDNCIPNHDTPLLDGLDWSSFAAMPAFPLNAPLTPESVPLGQFSHSGLMAANVADDNSEVLVGMGLYDESDKLIDDPQLDHSRSSMSMMLLGAMPTGKGLKLEETWQPPESDDEDDDDDDEEDNED